MNQDKQQTLPPQWRQWLLENLRRGCNPVQLAEILRENGLEQCTVALNEHELGLISGAEGVAVRPQPTTERNTLEVDGHTVHIVGVLDQPQVIFYDHLLSDEECDALCRLADETFVPATVVDEQDGSFTPHPHRSSEHACFMRGQTALIETVEKRIARLLDWPQENAEGMQVLRYATGGEYRAHFDYFDPQHPGSAKQMASGGQRIGTMLMYLSDVEAGGGTRFPELGLEARPRKGSAIYFAGVDAYGQIDPLSLHASVPVISGVKYAATKWIREKPYH
ncbi:MAG: 2OG-Fe(II) oxygenase [Neisseria sp.]|nr:2OG-Fe(II) oxygenase [Neisseria sp.]